MVTQFHSRFVVCSGRLGSHLSPSETECYITSDMFYVEVQLDTIGQLIDVKVAHHGENPAVSEKNMEKQEDSNREMGKEMSEDRDGCS